MLLTMERNVEKRFEGIGEQRLLTQGSKKKGFSNTSYERTYKKIIQSIPTIIQIEKHNLSENEVNAVIRLRKFN